MLYLTIVLALGAAFLNASSSVLQRQVAGQPEPHELFRRKFMQGVIASRLWIGAFGLEVVAFLFQAAALKNGSLVVVEPLLTVDLIFMMLLLNARRKFHVGRREWSAVVLICVGLSGLLFSASPRSGNKPFDTISWLFTVLVMVVLIGVAIYRVRRLHSSSWRAGLSGTAAGLSFSLVAAFTKLTTQQLHSGVWHILIGWQVYALLVSGILSILMTQNTYGAGPLAVSQPAMELCEPIVSSLMGVFLFGDTISLDTGALAGLAISSVVAGFGIWLMAGSNQLHVDHYT